MNIDANNFFREAAYRLCSSLDVETGLQSCFDYVKQFIPMKAMALYQFDPDEGIYRTIAGVNLEEEKCAHQIFVMPEIFREQAALNWKAMAAVEVVNRPAENSYYKELYEEFGGDLNTSKMQMKLELEGTRLGAVSVRTSGTDQYTEPHRRLFKMLHEPMAVAMSNALKHREVLLLKDMLADDNRYLHNQIREMAGTDIVGADFGLKRVLDLVRQVAPMDSPVLLLGETGTGKDVIANAIHSLSPRKEGPFIRVNCGAIPDNIIDSELFGHEKGAFTGAVSQKRGRFERADGGTIFLDEIGELPPQVQVRLLHVIQNGEIERVGGTASIPVNVRIISATHRNLQDMVATGEFREDLWFRLNVFPIMMPPLRQRKEDIPALVHHFMEKKRVTLKIRTKPALVPNAMAPLQDYNWPGNVRELENVVERAMIQCRNQPLDFSSQIRNTSEPASPMKSASPEITDLDEVISQHIRRILKVADGKINGPGGAGELLGINPNTLRKRMNKLNIPYGRKAG